MFCTAKSEGEEFEASLNGWGIGGWVFYKTLGDKWNVPKVMEIAPEFCLAQRRMGYLIWDRSFLLWAFLFFTELD